MAYRGEEGTIVYNGEIYNFLEIKTELETLGHTFLSGSDTEVLLTALHVFGLEEALRRFNGMWAFAWLDRAHNRLVLCRDRMGVKPLYIYQTADELIFASEIKGVLAIAGRKFALNHQAIGEFLGQSLLDTTDDTFFEGIRKIPAAHYSEFDLTGSRVNLRSQRYWSVPAQAESEESPSNQIERVRSLFIDAVRIRLRSDVPVGVLLSGGLDSSSIAAVMHKILGPGGALNILSAVSSDPRYDEFPFIDIMARRLGCDPQLVHLDFSAAEAMRLLSRVCWFNDEPVGSFSNVAHFLLMEHAKKCGITVLLSGQGGDEVLCGYRKYLAFFLQNLLSNGRIFKALKTLKDFQTSGALLNQFHIREAKRYLPRFVAPRGLDIRGPALAEAKHVPIGMLGCRTVMDRQVMDIERFSVPILVHYEDRSSMAWSREVRSPFLDVRLVEALVPLDISSKISNGWTKHIFRKAMEDLLPKEIAWRKDKQGFVNPQAEWLKNELVYEVRTHFRPDSLMVSHGLIRGDTLNKRYDQYLTQPSDSGNISYKDIFNPLSLEIWLRQFENHLSL